MTVSQIPFEPGAFTAPVVDYEPPPFDVAVGPAACPASPFPSGGWGPSLRGEHPQLPAALQRTPRRQLRPVERTASEILSPPAASEVAPPPAACEVAPPPAAFAFADAALRRVLEVIDRRRPIAQLRPMLTPPLLDMVFTLARSAGPDKAAVLRRVRLRTAAVDEPCQAGAAEVFATYSRGRRVRAIASRIELKEGRWRMVALQIG